MSARADAPLGAAMRSRCKDTLLVACPATTAGGREHMRAEAAACTYVAFLQPCEALVAAMQATITFVNLFTPSSALIEPRRPCLTCCWGIVAITSLLSSVASPSAAITGPRGASESERQTGRCAAGLQKQQLSAPSSPRVIGVRPMQSLRDVLRPEKLRFN